MAALYKRKNSPYWWAQYIDSTTQLRVQKSTGFRYDDPVDNAKAKELLAELDLREVRKKTHNAGEQWHNWVSSFLKEHCKMPRTYERYLTAWRWVLLYLEGQNISMPCDVTYQVAKGYLDWRQAYRKRGGRHVSLNTALNDMKVFRLVMRHAVRLGFAVGNPCDRLGVEKDAPKEKPDLTDQDIIDIRAALKSKPEWMQTSFEIAIYTGCRQSETQIAMRDIDFTRKRITFAHPKGGRGRAFTITMPKELEPLLMRLRDAGYTHTLKNPPRLLGKEWWSFFKDDLKRPDLCFHCTRVTFITRLARADVPPYKAMKLVNHSSTLVHAIYQRLGVDDVQQYSAVVAIPSA